jgi:hypothetical protein
MVSPLKKKEGSNFKKQLIRSPKKILNLHSTPLLHQRRGRSRIKGEAVYWKIRGG